MSIPVRIVVQNLMPLDRLKRLILQLNANTAIAMKPIENCPLSLHTAGVKPLLGANHIHATAAAVAAHAVVIAINLQASLLIEISFI